jgi:hypothetical protein
MIDMSLSGVRRRLGKDFASACSQPDNALRFGAKFDAIAARRRLPRSAFPRKNRYEA